MFRPFSTEWADAFRAAINNDTEYQSLARQWTWPVALVLEATPEHGYAQPIAVQFTINKGNCTAAEIMPPHTVSATFVFRADYDTWKRVAQDELDPIAAVTQGRIRFTGPLGTLLMHTKAATALVGAARAVPTQYPDDAV